MAIYLEKKKPVSLEKTKPGLRNIIAGLGWDIANVNGHNVDLDLSVFMMGINGKLPRDEFFVFYNNNTSPDGAAYYPGDSRDGTGDGDDEIISIDLAKIDRQIEFLYFAVTIDQAADRGHHFGYVHNAYINIRNAADNTLLCQYRLNEEFKNEDSLLIATLSRNDGQWDFEAVGQAFSGGLNTLVEMYQ
ncbi:TerD family protein [Chitinophaga silvisoli]|uniref:TerD family protein n=1 Tax=Chitinophaga silvisoli TaxID=2291814 RepID=A0A3E1P4P6_9BACT|nr:TerD family protein [Chitinophaga silvisoli]RFM35169.1 TerD family protein [Chitinophaga silvisoli]